MMKKRAPTKLAPAVRVLSIELLQAKLDELYELMARPSHHGDEPDAEGS